MTTLKFDEWQDVGGTPVLRIEAGVLEVWDGAAWGPAGAPGAASITSTTGSPTETQITDGGVTYDVYQFTGDGSITFSDAGVVELLILLLLSFRLLLLFLRQAFLLFAHQK